MPRIHPNPLIAMLLLISFSLHAQQPAPGAVMLRSGAVIPPKNIDTAGISRFNKTAGKINGQSFAVIRFDHTPLPQERQQLAMAGIELLEYIPGNAFTASITKELHPEVLKSVAANAFFVLEPQQKMHPLMVKGIYPSWAVKTPGSIDVWVSFPKTLSFELIRSLLLERNIEVIADQFKEYHVAGLRISQQRINEVASLPFIEYMEPAPHEDQPLVNISRNNSRANVLQSPVAIGGRDLRGQGVTVGVGDNANATYHVDFTGRIIDRAAMNNSVNHGVHVHGILGGGGIKEEKYSGYAPKATLVSQLFSGILANAKTYADDHHMVITNNSYGNIVGDCSYSGTYDLYSRILDQQAIDMPSLQHVFASGNSGNDNCAPYPAGFKTVLGSYQAAKNVLTVGNTLEDGTLNFSSSKGPVKDGRLKPEIVATGSAVISTGNTNIYYAGWGTSMAAPAVSGGLALLYQRYRQLNSGADPKSGLMKALICNGGRDVENEGPDFKSGFGWMNLLRSVDMLENHHFFTSAVTQGAGNSHTISVPSLPSGVAQLKVMLYWHDPAAAAFASRTLVNDLDLQVTTPSNATVLPRLLDTLPANVNNIAGTGADHLNNIEQVIINNPAAGNYTVTIKGTAINQNPSQEYFVVYDIVPVSTTLTYPVGGEGLVPGETVTINWDSYGDPANGFTIQTSTDDGVTWADATAAANARQLNWMVPSIATNLARVRIKREGTGLESTSQPFTIIGQPVVSLATTQCEGYLNITWTAVAGATQYEVMRLKGDEMVPVFVTADASVLNYTFNGLSKDSVYWVSLRALVNGKAGRRATAIQYQPNAGSCAGVISDNDLKIDSILSPVSGRQFTTTALTNNETLSISIKNLDDAPATDFTLRYRIDGGAWIAQHITTPINAGATAVYHFNGIDLSAVHAYNFEVEVMNQEATDPVHANDTLSAVIKQLANAPLNLATTFVDDFESTPFQTIEKNVTGLNALDRYDFSTARPGNGRLRSFVNSGIAHSGSKALTLDVNRYNAAGTMNNLTATFNLQNYNVATDDIRLDFFYKSHGQPPYDSNKVWIRGNDNAATPWLQVYDLNIPIEEAGIYKKSTSIEIGDLLIANGQAASSSMQVRWGQFGKIMATDNEYASGFTFDDIRLYKVTDDIQLLSIDTPITSSCGLSAAVPVKVTIRNSANNVISNIPVRYSIDGAAAVNETIASIAGNASIQYQFTAMANLSTTGKHVIKVWSELPSDTYRSNDTLVKEIVNAPLISVFPSLQNFENDNGNWYASGKNSSWEYGTPASAKINGAASGLKAWKTRLAGNYNDMEKSYLYSPCYNISGLIKPTLSFSVALDLEDCGATLCDKGYVEYSADGKTWSLLGSTGAGLNWYNKDYSGSQGWSVENYTRWHVATIPLPTGINNLRLRFVLESDPGVNREGIAIDDIHVYDNSNGIYDAGTLSTPVTQNINGGNAWIHFSSAGKLVASINPAGQVMGNTDVQAFINTGLVRNDSGHYYHDRNITIKPANALINGPVQVRFYFTDAEVETLLNATGCAACTKPAHAYQLGVPAYTDINKNLENGTIADNAKGSWTFLDKQKVAIVPFDKGYYAEFAVTHFSEFWLKKEAFYRAVVPIVQVSGFNASRQGNNEVKVEWTTTVAGSVNRFEVEVAKGNEAFQRNEFAKIGELAAASQTQSYLYTDAESNKTGARYYRLKIINNDGSILYSDVKVVVFEDQWGSLYPNPSRGQFNILFQLATGTVVNATVLDAQGRVVKKVSAQASGFQQKLMIDLSPAVYAPGLYMIRLENTTDKLLYKAIKQ